MKNKILVMATVSLIAVSSISVNAFADATTQNSPNKQMDGKQEKPKNVVFGKITAISEDSVTISVAEMKKPEGGRQNKETPLEKHQNDNQHNGNRPERKQLTDEELAEMKKKFEENITLTGETKTIDIKTANFNNFGRGSKGENKQAEKNDARNTTDTQQSSKTYKDYQVGDYIFIELTSENSNVAKSVRGTRMMGGMEPPKN